MGGTPSPWAPVRVTRESEPVQRRGRRGRLRFPEHAAANRTCHLAACGRLPGDAEEGVGTSQAGPQEADCVRRGSPGWPAVCRHHAPCVSLREARWPFLLHFLQFYSQGAWRLRTGLREVPHPCAPSAEGVGARSPSTVSVASSVTSLCSRISLWGLDPPGFCVQGLLPAEVWFSALGTDRHIQGQNTWAPPLLRPRTPAEEQDRTENRRLADRMC